MERVCDFCKALRPVVYCKADAAYLCLSCDAKVHSANALSGRHPRALVCEFCGSGLVNIRCPNHCLLLCRSCDYSMHKDLSSSQHQKQVISCCYLGCPPAKDLAKLWGFNLDEFGLDSVQGQFISTSCLSGNDGQSRAFGEASSDHNKVKRNIIIQQILDLEKLQLSDRCQNSSVIRGKDLSICNYDVSWELENSNNIGKPLNEASFDLDQQLDSSQQELNPDPFLLAYFPQLDQLTSNSGNPLQDSSSFWQYKSPTQKFQLWSQNMQDLGICEEVGCIDDLKMPDVDLTFRNFEELFGGGGHDLKEEALVDNKDMKSSIPTAYDNETMGHSRVIRPTSHSTMSFSLSRFCSTAKSNATDCSASSLSSPAMAVQGMHQTDTNDIDVLMKKNKQRKKDCRYNNDGHEPGAAGMRKRVKGRLVKGEEFNCEGVEVTQSY